MGRTLSSAALGVAIALLPLSCFYDSRWGEAKRAQRRAAQASAPAALQAAETERAPARVTRHRVRVLANVHYTAQTMDWQKQVRDLFADANRILGPSLGARLEIDSMSAWEMRESDDDLNTSLTALRADDGGQDVAWVVGLVGGMPRLSASLHQVGRAEVLGKHIVLRAAAREGEHDGIETAFDELSEEERTRLRRERKIHRALAVFLHELGHTLGAPHERDAHSIMHPAYDPKMAGFSAEATEMMRIALDHRADPPDRVATELGDYLRKSTASTWTSEERDEALAQFGAFRAPAAGSLGRVAAHAHVRPRRAGTRSHRGHARRGSGHVRTRDRVPSSERGGPRVADGQTALFGVQGRLRGAGSPLSARAPAPARAARAQR